MCVWSRKKETRVVTQTTDATFNTFAPGCTAGQWLSLRIPKENSVRREYFIRSGYYLRYLTTMSIAKVAWRRWDKRNISTEHWQDKPQVLGGQYVRLPLRLPQTAHGLSWEWTQTSAMWDRRLSAGAINGPCSLQTDTNPLQPSGHYTYRTVVTICTASLAFTNSTFAHTVCLCVDLRTVIIIIIIIIVIIIITIIMIEETENSLICTFPDSDRSSLW